MAPNPFAALRKSFASTSPEVRASGVAAVRALNATDVDGGLLAGVGVVAAPDGGVSLHGGELFTGKSPSEQLRLNQSLWAVLAALAPRHAGARAIADQVTSLSVHSGGAAVEMDLSCLTAFQALTTLDLRGLRPLFGCATLATLPKLKRVSFVKCGLGDGLAPLSTSTSIEEVNVEGDLLEPGELGAFRTLKRLSLKTPHTLLNLTGLRALESLESLSIDGMHNQRGVRELSQIASLRSLTLRNVQGLAELTGVESLSHLRTLVVDRCGGLHDLAPVAGLTDLEEIEVSYVYSALNLTPLTGCRRLKSVVLVASNPASLDPLAGNWVIPSFFSMKHSCFASTVAAG